MQMESNYMTKKDFDGIVQRLDEISQKLSSKEKKPSEIWITNEELMELLQLSRRTIQHFRDDNMIAFSIIGNRIYYRMTDVEDLLNRHYRKRLV